MCHPLRAGPNLLSAYRDVTLSLLSSASLHQTDCVRA
jgi:hypothetical protein